MAAWHHSLITTSGSLMLDSTLMCVRSSALRVFKVCKAFCLRFLNLLRMLCCIKLHQTDPHDREQRKQQQDLRVPGMLRALFDG